VSSQGKAKANRTNAQASTGPRTPKGRAHSARNAFRHGLSLPIDFDPRLSDQIRSLVLKISGASADFQTHELATRIAEAQLDLRRIRDVRRQSLSRVLSDLKEDSAANKLVGSKQRRSARLSRPKIAPSLVENLKLLLATERYQQRALSRAKLRFGRCAIKDCELRAL